MRLSTAINVGALVLGSIGFAVALHQVGAYELHEIIVTVGISFAAVAAIDVASVFSDAFALHGYLRPHVPISYWRVFAVEFSGLAINRVSPMNSLGEPVKMTMLMRDVPGEHAVSAVVMFNLTNTYVALAAIAIGVPISVAMLDLSGRLALAVWTALGVLLVSAAALALLVRHGPLGTLIDALRALRLISDARKDRWRAKVGGIDERLRALGSLRAPGMRRGVIGVIGSRVLNSIGTVVVVHAVGIPVSAALVIALLSIGILVGWIANIVPLGIGVSEGGNYGLYALFGASPHGGLLFALVNRLRTMLLAAIGLLVMAVANIVHRRRQV